MPGKRRVAESAKSDVPPWEVLTEAQLACVRLVPKGPSKVIAKQLGISHHTVDDHIREAMRRLGVTTRREAAAIVAEWDAAHPQGLGTQPRRVANLHEQAMIGVSSAPAGTPMPVQHTAVREERAEFSASHLRSVGLVRLTQYWFGSLFDDLTGQRRIRGTLLMALIVSLIVLALVGIGNAVQVSVLAYLKG